MLKKIDQSEIDQLDDAQRQNLMVNAEGEYVFAQADEKAWKKHLEQVKAAEAAQKNVQVGDKELQDRGLECPIDKRLFVDPMKTPCCGKTYCHNCIENALLENDLTCPGCETENISLERLEPDEEVKTKIKKYEADKTQEKKERSKSPTVAAETPKANGSARDESGSPPSSSDPSRKRSASDAEGSMASGNLTVPAMKRQKSGDAASSSTPKPEKDEDDKKDGGSEKASPESNPVFPANMMPPDFSQMQAGGGMNFPMMPNFNPFMMNPMAMGMGMNGMNGMNGMGMGMNGMNGMNFMNPNFNMMNGMNMMPQGNGNMGMGNQNQMPNWNQNQNQPRQNMGPARNQFNQRPARNPNVPQQPQPPQQPVGMTGVPTGPKAQTTQQNQANSFAPTGPSGNKFSNQQRHLGNEEDTAYMRQPVNPQRHVNRNRRARQADYREL